MLTSLEGVDRWTSHVARDTRTGATAVSSPATPERINDMNGIIDVSSLALRMREGVRQYVTAIAQSPNPIRLVGILAQAGPYRADSELYSERIAETFAEDGMVYELHRCPGESPADVEDVIRAMNQRQDVHGILVFYPIFKREFRIASPYQRAPYLDKFTGVHYKTHDDYLRDSVVAEKDVEGLSHNHNARWLFRARGINRADHNVYVPCTALSVMRVLNEYHFHSNTDPGRWHDTTITVVNRSEIMGRPLAALLALQGANVYSIDECSTLLFRPHGRLRRCFDLTLEECLLQSSVVVTGVPSPHFLLPHHAIAAGTTVVNVSEFSNVCEQTLFERPGVKLIPTIGKVTVAALEENLIRLHQQHVQGSNKNLERVMPTPETSS